MIKIIRVLKNTLLFLFTTNALYAAPALPVSTQTNDSKVEISDEIKIEAQSSTPSSDPKLKQGDACSDSNENLEEAEGKLITIVDIKMAEVIPCEKVDCSDLKPAKMGKIIIRKLPPMAKTISCGKK